MSPSGRNPRKAAVNSALAKLLVWRGRSGPVRPSAIELAVLDRECRQLGLLRQPGALRKIACFKIQKRLCSKRRFLKCAKSALGLSRHLAFEANG